MVTSNESRRRRLSAPFPTASPPRRDYYLRLLDKMFECLIGGGDDDSPPEAEAFGVRERLKNRIRVRPRYS
jgi:hypothetical protein